MDSPGCGGAKKGVLADGLEGEAVEEASGAGAVGLGVSGAVVHIHLHHEHRHARRKDERHQPGRPPALLPVSMGYAAAALAGAAPVTIDIGHQGGWPALARGRGL